MFFVKFYRNVARGLGKKADDGNWNRPVISSVTNNYNQHNEMNISRPKVAKPVKQTMNASEIQSIPKWTRAMELFQRITSTTHEISTHISTQIKAIILN